MQTGRGKSVSKSFKSDGRDTECGAYEACKSATQGMTNYPNVRRWVHVRYIVEEILGCDQ
jgi:hypothetical protein